MSARQRGAGTFGTAAGLAVFLLLLLAAAQILFDLQATSTVTAAGHDAARQVAGYTDGAARCSRVPAATAGFERRLEGYLRRGRADLDWVCDDPGVVTVRIRAIHPSFLPSRLHGLLPLGRVDRTLAVRVERLQ